MSLTTSSAETQAAKDLRRHFKVSLRFGHCVIEKSVEIIDPATTVADIAAMIRARPRNQAVEALLSGDERGEITVRSFQNRLTVAKFWLSDGAIVADDVSICGTDGNPIG